MCSQETCLTANDGTRYDYLHMEELTITTGDVVRKGQRLGKISNRTSGGTHETTVHLHFNIQQFVDGVGMVFVPPYRSLVESYKELTGDIATPIHEFESEFVSQSFPLASQAFNLMQGQQFKGYIELRNVGSVTWKPGKTMLGTTEPRDVDSLMKGPDWLAPNRAATIDREVPPGQTGRFEFTIQAPLQTGEFSQFFNPIQEHISWFADSGGPAENRMQIRVTVDGCNLGSEWVCSIWHGDRVRCNPGLEREICPDELACEDGLCVEIDHSILPTDGGVFPTDGGGITGVDGSRLDGSCALSQGRSGHPLPMTWFLLGLWIWRRRSSCSTLCAKEID